MPPVTHSAAMEVKHVDIQYSRGLQVNWGTINIPTIISVLGLLWYTATHTERQDSRLETLEATRVDWKEQVNSINSQIAPLGNMVYRLTAAEATIQNNNASVNQRIDRFNDTITSVRNDINKLSTNIEVMSNKLDNVLPMKKTDLNTPKNNLTPSSIPDGG